MMAYHRRIAMTTRSSLLTGMCALAVLSGCGHQAAPSAADSAAAPAANDTLADWPRIESAVKSDPALEARVREIVTSMSLAQKIGQMTQAEIKSISPEQVSQYYIGSVLNGGGSWPGGNKHASVQDWLDLAERYREASMASDAAMPVPILWGTDAVHGHGNVFGATLFPHNIGLGAAHDPELVQRIGAATAQAVRATGIDWVFAPTLAVVQNARWGRSYESFAADGALVRDYARAYVSGMQGAFGDANTLATAKHFIGDGATDGGKDQGNALVSRHEMINRHAAGYYGAIEAGVQTVMASYNSWHDVGAGVDYGKMHGAKALLSDALKEKIGFDGFVVSDWNAIGQLPDCSNASCPQAINAGIDMVMVPDDWQAFIANTMQQVQQGSIPMARIDDAVSRIVRVKLRAGLFDKSPAQRTHAGDVRQLQAPELARQAVRESLVLLKNNRAALPLMPGKHILVVGKNADRVANQAGGWSLTWQGTDNDNSDYPNADSILAGIREAAGAANVVYSETAQGVNASDFDAVVAVLGETPYAETSGDIIASATLRHSARYPEDLAVLDAVSGHRAPVIAVFLSGRPLYVNDLLNRSTAFVAAWLPGTAGKGVADVLFGNADGTPRVDFRGSLTFAWPATPCPDRADADGALPPPLFAVGYGLRYGDNEPLAELPTHADVQECASASSLPIFRTADVAPFALYVADAAGTERAVGSDLNAAFDWPEREPALRLRTVQVNTQQDAKQVTWIGAGRLFARSSAGNNLKPLAMADGALQWDVLLATPPQDATTVSMGCGHDCVGSLDLGPTLSAIAPGTKRTLKIPLACFSARGTDLANVDMPFAISASAPFAAAFADIRIVAGAARDADALSCEALGPH